MLRRGETINFISVKGQDSINSFKIRIFLFVRQNQEKHYHPSSTVGKQINKIILRTTN
jgi:hypothetical protein